MIPKIIHYVWLSGDPMPLPLQACIKSWRDVLPDYEIICWNKQNFDVETVPFVKEACKVKKWAFACDYIRLYALYTCGGIYLDSDVLIKKSLNEFLNNDFFTSVEYHSEIFKIGKSADLLTGDGIPLLKNQAIPGVGIQAAIMGSVKQHSFVRDCMDYYHGKHFINDDGGFNDGIIAPSIFALKAERYGFRYVNERQQLKENMLILPSTVFASTRASACEDAHAIHCCAGSWREPEKIDISDRILGKVKSLFKKK